MQKKLSIEFPPKQRQAASVAEELRIHIALAITLQRDQKNYKLVKWAILDLGSEMSFNVPFSLNFQT